MCDDVYAPESTMLDTFKNEIRCILQALIGTDLEIAGLRNTPTTNVASLSSGQIVASRYFSGHMRLTNGFSPVCDR